MTITDLRQYKSIQVEIKRLDNRIDELVAEYQNCRNEAVKAELLTLTSTFDDLHYRLIRRETEIVRDLRNIEDSQVRLAIQLHFFDGLKWDFVAAKIGGNTTDSIKKKVYRFLKVVPNVPKC